MRIINAFMLLVTALVCLPAAAISLDVRDINCSINRDGFNSLGMAINQIIPLVFSSASLAITEVDGKTFQINVSGLGSVIDLLILQDGRLVVVKDAYAQEFFDAGGIFVSLSYSDKNGNVSTYFNCTPKLRIEN